MFKSLLNVITGKEKIHVVKDELSTLKFKLKSGFNVYTAADEFEPTPERYLTIKNKLFEENYDMVLYFCSEPYRDFGKQKSMTYLETALLKECNELDSELYFIKPITAQGGFEKYDLSLYGTLININDQILPIVHLTSIKGNLLVRIKMFVKFINDNEYAKTGKAHLDNILNNFMILKNE